MNREWWRPKGTCNPRWAGLFVMLIACATHAAQSEPERTGGPYVPTPQIVVDEMLRMAKVGPKDFVIDLGSGDGVIVLTAARQYKARGMGLEIDPELVKLSNAEAKRLGVDERATFQVQDVFKADLSKASVITLYLLPSMMENLRGKIFLEARPGTRVVSHDYSFGEWQPDDRIELDVPEKEKVNGVPKAYLFKWVVPAKIGGKWDVRLDGGVRYEMTLRQHYQLLDGTARVKGRPIKFLGRMHGPEVTFTVSDGATRHHFRGTTVGDALQGSVETGGRTVRWTAKRL